MLITTTANLPFILNAEFGQVPRGARLSQVRQSPYYRDGQFHNQVPTPGYTDSKDALAAWRKLLVAKRENARPARSLPMVTTDLAGFSPQQDTLVWLGHSSWYLQLASQRVLTNPVFSNYAAPFSFLSRAFAGDCPWTTQAMPEINLFIISHDHYDHLDLAIIKALMPKVKRVITPFSVGSHLRYWGMRNKIIEERDWNQSVRVTDSLIVHMLPTRHFSERGIKRNQTLWASFMFEMPGQDAYCSDDSGYGPHFKAVDEQFGSVDLAIMENDQYGQNWKLIHMMSEGTTQAAVDLHARAVLPGRAGRLVLAKHTWGDPHRRLAFVSRHQNYRLLTPMLGEPIILSEPDQLFTAWRRQVAQ